MFQPYDGFTNLKKTVLLLIEYNFHYSLLFNPVQYAYLRFFPPQYSFSPMLNCFIIYVSLSFCWFNHYVSKSPKKFIQRTSLILLLQSNYVKHPQIKNRQCSYLLTKSCDNILVFFPALYVYRRLCSPPF